MALIGLQQPGRILLLTEGYRGNLQSVRDNVLPFQEHALALHGLYPPHREHFRNLCDQVPRNSDIRELANQFSHEFSLLDVESAVGGVLAGFLPGGNPQLVGFWSGNKPDDFRTFYPLVVGDLDSSVANYFVKTLLAEGMGLDARMSQPQGLDFVVFLALIYASLFASGGYADAFGVASLTAGKRLQWLSDTEIEQSIDRNVQRFGQTRQRLGWVLGS